MKVENKETEEEMLNASIGLEENELPKGLKKNDTESFEKKELEDKLNEEKEENKQENKHENKELKEAKSIDIIENEEIQEKKYNNYEKVIEENKNRKSHTKLVIGILISFLIITIILFAFSTIFALINMNNKNAINGISIGKIDVSNMSKEEMLNKLNEIYNKKTENEIILVCGEYETTINFSTLDVKFNIEKAVEEAYNTGRNSNIFINNIEIIKTYINKKEIKVDLTIDDEMINQISQNINNNMDGAVVEPSYYIENDNTLIITKGKKGNIVNNKELLKQIYSAIENEDEELKIEIPLEVKEPEELNIDNIYKEVHKDAQDAYYTENPFTIHPEVNGIDFDLEAARAMLQEDKEEYEITLKIISPSVTVKQFGSEAFPNLLATCSTRYNAGDTNRTTNLRLAANKINGTVLLPGETFSYNKIVGERTIAAGYKEAKVFSAGQVVDGLGGGICQISSTLYDAVVFANLNVTVRRNHQFVTSYLPAGKDATVVWGSQDFQFVNTRKYPVKIEASVSGGTATVSVYGIKEEVEYDISIETKKTATLSYTTQYIQDSTIEAGKEVIVQNGNNGQKIEAYKVIRLDGKVVSSTLLSKDTYNPMQRIVRVGTKSENDE